MKSVILVSDQNGTEIVPAEKRGLIQNVFVYWFSDREPVEYSDFGCIPEDDDFTLLMKAYGEFVRVLSFLVSECKNDVDHLQMVGDLREINRRVVDVTRLLEGVGVPGVPFVPSESSCKALRELFAFCGVVVEEDIFEMVLGAMGDEEAFESAVDRIVELVEKFHERLKDVIFGTSGFDKRQAIDIRHVARFRKPVMYAIPGMNGDGRVVVRGSPTLAGAIERARNRGGDEYVFEWNGKEYIFRLGDFILLIGNQVVVIEKGEAEKHLETGLFIEYGAYK